MNNQEFLVKIKVLNDDTRLNILQALSKNGTMCACKILDELSITQGTLSHHMKVLSDANFVSVEKEGKWRHYTLINENICEVAQFIQEICKEKKSAGCCCEQECQDV